MAKKWGRNRKHCPMSDQFNRRHFIRKSLVASAAGAVVSLSMEEQALVAAEAAPQPIRPGSAGTVEAGQLGNLSVSRLICGGNLISGYAHSRDLMYVSPLLKHYFTDEKIMETWRICEEHGINTMIAYSQDQRAIELFAKYHQRSGTKMQWLAQIAPSTSDLKTVVDQAIDHGACGAFLLGNIGDRWVMDNRLDLVDKLNSYIKDKGILSGVAGHAMETPLAVDAAGIEVDFYMKTVHSTNYWSARRPNQQKAVIDNYETDNYWDLTPQETIEVMREIKKPWIAYKVLAAGAIQPRQGFDFAFKNGADFACVGMFDFQIAENVTVANQVVEKYRNGRARPWMA